MMATVMGVVAMDDDGAADAAVGDTFTVGDLEYEIVANRVVTVSGPISNSISGALIVPSEVTYQSTNYQVQSINDSAFEDCYYLTSATISKGILSIGESAFARCDSLESIVIPDSVTSIGAVAFMESAIESLSLSGSIDYLGPAPFSSCYYLSTVTIENGITNLSAGMFQSSPSLTSITIPASVETIEDYAFYGCVGLSTITFKSEEAPIMGAGSFSTGSGEINVFTPGWNPVTALSDAITDDAYGPTTVVWAGITPLDLTFLSNPVTNGTLAYNPIRTNKTALTA